MQRQPQYVQRHTKLTDSPDSASSDVAPVPSPPPAPPASAYKELPRLLGDEGNRDAGNKSYWQPVQTRHWQREQPTERAGLRAQSLKSQMCRYFKTEMGCRRGDQCAYSHSTEEWQRSPDLAKKWVPKEESQGAPDLAKKWVPKEDSQEAPDQAKTPLRRAIAKEDSQEAPDLAKTPLRAIAKEESQGAPDLGRTPLRRAIAKEEPQGALDMAKASLCKAIAEKLQGASDLPRLSLCETIAEESQEAPDVAKSSLCEAIAREIVARRRALEQAHWGGEGAPHQVEKATAPAPPPGHEGQSKGLGSLAAVLRNVPLPKQDVGAEPSSVEKTGLPTAVEKINKVQRPSIKRRLSEASTAGTEGLGDSQESQEVHDHQSDWTDFDDGAWEDHQSKAASGAWPPSWAVASSASAPWRSRLPPPPQGLPPQVPHSSSTADSSDGSQEIRDQSDLDFDEAACEEGQEAGRASPPSPDTLLASAPWRVVLPPPVPGLGPPTWEPPLGIGAADWRQKLPWRSAPPPGIKAADWCQRQAEVRQRMPWRRIVAL